MTAELSMISTCEVVRGQLLELYLVWDLSAGGGGALMDQVGCEGGGW